MYCTSPARRRCATSAVSAPTMVVAMVIVMSAVPSATGVDTPASPQRRAMSEAMALRKIKPTSCGNSIKAARLQHWQQQQ